MKESLSQSKKNDTCIKVIIASHRLPLQIKDGTLIPSDGGLVSAIEGAGLSNETAVTLVQRAHRRHEPEWTFGSSRRNPGPQVGDRLDDQ